MPMGIATHVIVVAQSYGGFTAPLVADRRPVDLLVFVAGMIPTPGETPGDWWENTGYRQAVEEQARRDGGATGNDDPFVAFYHDVPRELAEEAMSSSRGESDTTYKMPWPLDSWPDVPTRFVLCTEDRFFPPDFMRKVVADQLTDRAEQGARPATVWRSAARTNSRTCSRTMRRRRGSEPTLRLPFDPPPGPSSGAGHGW